MLPDADPPIDPPESGEGRQALAESDAGLARVMEDLIDVLITRGVIHFTDLPEAAQSKLLQRRQKRSTLSRRLSLLEDGDDLI